MIEALVATALALSVTAAALALVRSSEGHFSVREEAVDMHQRLRVAAGTLYGDLLHAGAGADRGPNRGPLAQFFAPVLPYRQGTGQDDPVGSFSKDTITVMFVPSTAAQTTLSAAAPGGVSGEISLNIDSGCPVADPVCGFRKDMRLVLYDAGGQYDTFTVTDARSNPLQAQRVGRGLTSASYDANTTTVAQLVNVVYSLKVNRVTDTYQLVVNDGGNGNDVPVVDHLVALEFEYFGDPNPPVLTGRAVTEPVGPWTSYGPAPPTPDRQIPTQGYPPGENCIFIVDPLTGVHLPRLDNLALGGSSGLVPLTQARLTDGPWCPDAASQTRWDADLLRVRRVGVTLRVQAANRALRGPAGLLFSNGGTSTGGYRWLPDQQIRLAIAPRNLEMGR
ncbi:MAG TPA: hypothetical protein VM818_00060 [Vicinamibacterales bacterium]|nr:hypothetical protein [Vicinamibacterales bacterium]